MLIPRCDLNVVSQVAMVITLVVGITGLIGMRASVEWIRKYQSSLQYVTAASMVLTSLSLYAATLQ